MYFEYFSRVTEEVHIFNFLKNKQLNYLLESNAQGDDMCIIMAELHYYSAETKKTL